MTSTPDVCVMTNRKEKNPAHRVRPMLARVAARVGSGAGGSGGAICIACGCRSSRPAACCVRRRTWRHRCRPHIQNVN